MRIGVYCGSFNPVHHAHLMLAESCREQLTLDRVVFVPSPEPPNKRGQRLAPAEARFDMLSLAVGGRTEFEVSRVELDREGPSWTVETLRLLHAHYATLLPDAETHLFLLGGADMFADLPHWYRASEILNLAIPVGIRRPGYPSPDIAPLAPFVSPERLHQIAACSVEMPQMELSASNIRQRLRDGLSVRYRTPIAVECFIREHQLYQREP
ncbi:MAG: nicotinate-nucleotide adenylyltransferase [Thermoguttaceae bacterium]|nr:nicotinate-nucleotide adenylyltransferase [Thermoguttaceae bacterium]